MKRRTKRLLGIIAAGGLGAIGAILVRNKRSEPRVVIEKVGSVWARPGMSVTFRAEIMPSRETSERTFRVEKLLPSGRVTLVGFPGEHTETEFEAQR
ncbi:MAG: hypothetical protein WBP93_09420 [Pyrinomonadaceae bacterium]